MAQIKAQATSVSQRTDNAYNKFAEQGKEQFRALCWLSKSETCENPEKPVSITREPQLFCVSP